MRPPLFSASRRLPWSRWLVLALMALCLPLQGALAVTMQMGMALGGTGGAVVPGAPAGVHGMHSMSLTPAPTPASGADIHPCHPASTTASPHGDHPAAHEHDAHAHAHVSAPANAHGQPGDHGAHAHRLDDGAATHCAVTVDHPTDCNAAGASPTPTGDTHHGCSFCAQCCIGVALLATPLTVASSPLADMPAAAAPAALLDHQPQTPDRPPKPSLA
ncbi:hypothetical protein [Roseateles depolymerans]|uniref:hypothetical protein n=1 Tax=Roseateles depolymerans TaxID=76731 RepID=UPI00073D1A82|nr:hypothetical protein [Roseateles depolymerans]